MIPTSCQGPPRGGEEAPPFLKRRGREPEKERRKQRLLPGGERRIGQGRGGKTFFCGFTKRAKLHVYINKCGQKTMNALTIVRILLHVTWNRNE